MGFGVWKIMPLWVVAVAQTVVEEVEGEETVAHGCGWGFIDGGIVVGGEAHVFAGGLCSGEGDKATFCSKVLVESQQRVYETLCWEWYQKNENESFRRH